MAKKEIKTGFTNKKYREKNKFILLKNRNEFNHHINYKLLSKFDFVPKLIKETENELIWKFIEGNVLKKPSTNDLKQLGKIIKRIHNSNLKFPPNNLKKRTKKYLDIIYDKKRIVPEIEDNYKSTMKLINNMNDMTPCHNDIWFENVIKDDNGKLWIVDWEYATMGDKYFDLAYFMESFYLTKKQKDIFLVAYNLYNDDSKIVPKVMYKYEKFVNYLTLCWILAQKKLPFPTDKIIKRLNNYKK